MYVLGIHEGILATCCLLKDGEIIACASEERFTRVKNQKGFPQNAVDFILSFAGISPKDLDLVVLSFRQIPLGVVAPLFEEESTSLKRGGKLNFYLWHEANNIRRKYHVVEYHFPKIKFIGSLAFNFSTYFFRQKLLKERIRKASDYLGIGCNKIIAADHHESHAFSAYYGSPWRNKDVLVCTLDQFGDKLCSTVNVLQNEVLKRIAQTPQESSLGWLYADTTSYLGMKPYEHEYKVMGLAPYAPPDGIERTYKIMKQLIDIGKTNPLIFESKMRSQLYYLYLKRKLEGHRFDWIAGAVQKLTEELICRWIQNAIQFTGIRRVALAGGVFMNVKTNLRILELPEVEELFVMPSCGDESTPIGAAYWGYQLLCDTHGIKPNIHPIREIYFGPQYDEEEISSTLKEKASKYKIDHYSDIEGTIAELLSKDKVVAIFNGRMEWGARALGNRSILANASNWETVKIINYMIKQRDFWMPFAPTILKEREDEYIHNLKKTPAPYMILAFHSTSLAQKDLVAAMHPYDSTVRPQVLEKSWNESYYKILKEYENLTGRGGFLNTSFNLHGEPIVCSPSDALHVFENSGLQYLAIGNYLITKPP